MVKSLRLHLLWPICKRRVLFSWTHTPPLHPIPPRWPTSGEVGEGWKRKKLNPFGFVFCISQIPISFLSKFDLGGVRGRDEFEDLHKISKFYSSLSISEMKCRNVFWILAAALLTHTLFSQNETSPLSPRGVNNFNVEYYMGNWYQISDFPQPYEIFCTDCTQAVYWVVAPNNISVLNFARNPRTGKECMVQGYATAPDPQQPTQLVVSFPGVAPFPAPYWIIQLGPVIQSKYSYSVVSNPDKTTLYILARTRTMDQRIYQTIVQNLEKLGYPVSALVLTNQQACPVPETFRKFS